MEKDENKNIQIKPQESQQLSGPIKFFSDDSNFVFILKKTEKLSSAIYLITGFFDDKEPLKWQLRSLSGKLLSQSLDFKDVFSSKKEKAVLEIESSILEIQSLLAIAKNAGLISEMNYGIINKEFNNFADSLSLQSEALIEKGKGDIKKEYFNVRESFERKKPIQIPDEVVDYRQSTNVLNKPVSNSVELETLKRIEKPEESSLYGDIRQKSLNSDSTAREHRQLKEFGAVAIKKNSRQSIIISLLKRKKEIMIKDVSPLIEGCSEKTIQRELLSMVDKGILRKTGEKRWSRYSLV